MEKTLSLFKNYKEKITLTTMCTLIIIILLFITLYSKSNNNISFGSVSVSSPKQKDFVYLSDIPYDKNNSSVGWGQVTLDKNLDTKYNKGLITLIIDGKPKSFLKGIAAHATSTVVYDINGLGYDYFSTYYGVDASRGSTGNGVKFSIYTSTDGVNWDLETLVSPPVKKGNTEAEFIKINVSNKNYIKLYANSNGNLDGDHAVYGNAKLYKEGYDEEASEAPYNFIKTLEEYDNILANSSYDDLLTSKEMTLLQRKFVKSLEYDMLQAMAHLSEENKEAIEWILTDKEALKYYITGGAPTGSYINSVNVLIKLYTLYKDDLKNTTSTEYTTLGNLYKRMIISLSLTHSSNVCLWVGGNQCSDASTRYAVYKKMHANDLLINKVFETLSIEEMRWVMNNIIDDEEIEWLNHHIRKFPSKWGPYTTDPYHYIVYRFGYNYNKPEYYSEENYSKWDAKYDLRAYNITYQTGKPKLWIVFEQGSVCGGLSKTGSNINASLGNPSGVIGQPGHAAYLEYSETADGKGMWSIKNDVSGWTASEKGERLLAGWGSNNWDSYYNVTYVPYAQEGLNDIDNYNKALEVMLLADLYQGDVVKLEEIYRKALEYQSINMNAWYGLIRTYQQNENKTAEDYYNLAKYLADNMYEFPVPMFDLLNLLVPNISQTNYYASYTNYLKASLEKGTKVGTTITTNLLQPGITRLMANYLLGKGDYSIASFSFNGENANKIVLGSKYEGNGVRWDYSLDGGNTWTSTSESSILLSNDEINRINATDDIKIHIVGVNYSAENIYTIDITDNNLVESNFYRNDLENRIMGINLNFEWRQNENDAWTSYADASPNNTGNKTLQIRERANGTKLASNILTYTFTEDNQPDTRKYVSVSHLSIHGVSSQATGTNQNGNATYAIDGNYNTRWHSAWNGSDNNKWIAIKLDKPISLSSIEYVPADGGNGRITRIKVEGSMDGTNWEEIYIANLANNMTTKDLVFAERPVVQYVRITGVNTTSAGGGNFIAARMFNFFQDITNSPHPTAGVGYSPTEPTTGNVTARLINKSTEDIRITNNGGSDTYVFTENGEFTFEFIDMTNNKTGSAKAKVDWIDRVAPTGTITYNTTSPTNQEVIATLTTSEEVTITNKSNYSVNEDGQVLDSEGNILDGYTVDDEWFVKDKNGNIITNINPYRHEFDKNGEFTFEFVDRAGNKGSATAKVDWIDLEPPLATLTYSKTTLTNEDVTVTIDFNENATVINNSNSKSYTFKENGEFTFEFRDTAGNRGTIKAKVNWIDKIAPTAELKYENIDSKVVVTVINPSEEITYKEGIGVYEFTSNGNYDIIFYDKAGNVGKLTAVITSFKDDTNNPDNPVVPGNPDDNNPDKPNEGDKPGTNEPNNPSNPGGDKPNGGNNSGGNTGNKPGTDNKPNKPVNTEYKKYTVNGINVEIPVSALIEEGTLKADKFELADELKGKFGELSEYYYIHMINSNSEKLNITSSSPIKISIRLKGLKEFIGVYEITEDNKIKLVDYVKNGNNIEITTKNLGKYVVSYKELKAVSPNATLPVIYVHNKKNNFMWIVASIGILVLGLIIYILKKPQKLEQST